MDRRNWFTSAISVLVAFFGFKKVVPWLEEADRIPLRQYKDLRGIVGKTSGFEYDDEVPDQR